MLRCKTNKVERTVTLVELKTIAPSPPLPEVMWVCREMSVNVRISIRLDRNIRIHWDVIGFVQGIIKGEVKIRKSLTWLFGPWVGYLIYWVVSRRGFELWSFQVRNPYCYNTTNPILWKLTVCVRRKNINISYWYYY